MATKTTAQDLMICDMCETSPVQMHCNSCEVNLCNDCIAKHISADTKKDHNMVIFKMKNTKPIFPSCKTHEDINCEMKCKQCDTPVCARCLASGSHKKHDLIYLLDLCNSQKDIIKQKTTTLEKSIYPKYEKLITDLEIQIYELPQKYEKFESEISDQGEKWHQEVDIIINKHKEEVEKMKTDDLATLKKLLEHMKKNLSTLRQAIVDNKEVLQSMIVTKVLDRETTSPEMWDPPPSIDATPPMFTPLPIQGEQLHQMFGTLIAASMPQAPSPKKLVEDKLDTAMKQLQLLDSPKSASSLHTGCNTLYNISCLSSDEVWVSGNDDKIKRFIMDGSLRETVTTTKGNIPSGITVNRQGDLIYTDFDRSINRVRHGKTEKIISVQQDWEPWAVCCTASDDLLVVMYKPSMPIRVVRYSGSTEKQVIQFDEQGKPLFSSTNYVEAVYITDNTDKDMICVSDWRKKTVVVLNQAGKVCFRYTGNLSSQKYKSFDPHGVVIDSMGHILVADCNNDCIHIIDEQGQFLHYIDNCQLSQPWDLSLDRNNTLYVAEYKTGKVKVIKYLR